MNSSLDITLVRRIRKNSQSTCEYDWECMVKDRFGWEIPFYITSIYEPSDDQIELFVLSVIDYPANMSLYRKNMMTLFPDIPKTYLYEESSGDVKQAKLIADKLGTELIEHLKEKYNW